MITHAAIIPLIGGELLASDDVFCSRPSYILSYKDFYPNERHLLNYYNSKREKIPYINVEMPHINPGKVDVVSTLCPCAGLSQAHSSHGESNLNNEWMEKTAKYILGEIKPKIFWGENSGNLAGKIGEFMRERLRRISQENGYGMSIYLTKNINHGIPQFRRRSFYFFWDKTFFGNQVPKLNNIHRNYTKIEDVILGVNSNAQRESYNKKIPSKDDPYYKYLLEEVYDGISHREFFDLFTFKNVRENDVESIIGTKEHSYLQVANWMGKNNYDKEAVKCQRKYEKLNNNGAVRTWSTIIAKEMIGAFVIEYPKLLAHPHEDRYIDYREAMTIMGLPQDFELLDPHKSINHVCQNVPYQTAYDMALEVRSALEGKRELMNTDYLFQNNYDDSYEDWNRNSYNLSTFFS